MEFGEERTVKKTEIYQRWLDISVNAYSYTKNRTVKYLIGVLVNTARC